MWINGHDILVNTEFLNTVYVDDYDKEYYLMATCTQGGGTIDLYESRDAAESAKDWFYLLLTGEIDKDDWEQGRIDADARDGILERKKAAETETASRHESSIDQLDRDAYEHAWGFGHEADNVMDYYEDVLSISRARFRLVLRQFHHEMAVRTTTPENPAQYLAHMFEKATGIEYDGELNC